MKLENLIQGYRRKPAQMVYENEGSETPESDSREVYEAMERNSQKSDEDLANDAEKEQEVYIQGLIASGHSKEEAEQLAEKEYGFKPGSPLDAPEIEEETTPPESVSEMGEEKPVSKEEIDKRYSEIFDIISQGYRKLQEQGRIGE